MNTPLSALSQVSVSLASFHLQPGGISVVSKGTTDEPRERPFSPDKVDISPQARRMSLSLGVSEAGDTEQSSSDHGVRMSEQELRELQTLKRRDAEVRAHEQAHLAAAGQYARGGASFSFERGPDGASYAIGGQVNIDLSKEGSPEDTVRKMQTVRRGPSRHSLLQRPIEASLPAPLAWKAWRSKSSS
jgi:SprA-related family